MNEQGDTEKLLPLLSKEWPAEVYQMSTEIYTDLRDVDFGQETALILHPHQDDSQLPNMVAKSLPEGACILKEGIDHEEVDCLQSDGVQVYQGEKDT